MRSTQAVNTSVRSVLRRELRRGMRGNTDRAKSNVAKYQRENRDVVHAQKRAWDRRNKETVRARQRKYAENYPERRSASRLKWNSANRSRIARVTATWQKANRAKCSGYWAMYNAAKLCATPKWANKFFISEAYALANLRTKKLGYPWHVDHIVPLKSKIVCGLHVEHNLQVIEGSLNMSKGNRVWPDMPPAAEVQRAS